MKIKRGSVFVLTAATMAAGAAPAAAETVYGVTGEAAPRLVTFDSATPGTLRSSVAISGLPAGRAIAGIDVRPATQRLTVLDSAGQLYTLDELSGALTTVGSALPETGNALDIDYNPTVDRLRVTGQAGAGGQAVAGAANNGNARVNPNNGALGAVDGNVAFQAGVGDPNEGDVPVLAATGYTNSAPSSAYAPNPPATAQFGIDAGNDVLVRHTNPNAGTLRTVGALGVDVTAAGASGFDVVTDADGTTNRAYAALGPAATPAFYTVDTTSGAATKVADFPATAPVVDIAVAPTPPILVALRDTALGQQLTFFASNRPQDAGDTSVAVSGLPAGVTLSDIDQRPANGALYGLGSDGVLYTVAIPSGQASAIAAVTPAPSGTAFGFDFNPTVDRIRIVSDTGQNLRVNPDTGAALVDGALPVRGVTAAAYTNSVRGATATTLFDIDSATDRLQIQNPPNDGALVDVGPLNQPVSAEDGYDIAPRFNHGFATGDATLNGTNLLAVNVAATAPTPPATIGQANGGAVVVGRLTGGRPVRGLAVYDVRAVVATPSNPGTPPANPPALPPATGTPAPAPATSGKLRARISYSRVARDRRSPFRYTLRGRVVPKGTAAAGAFAGGRVTVRVKRAGTTRTLVTRRADVSSSGRFSLRVTVPRAAIKRRGSGVVRLNLTFSGTDALFDARAFPRARYR